MCLKDGEDILFHCQTLEDRRFLAQVPHSFPCPLVDGKVGNILILEDHPAAVRPYGSNNHIERGALTGVLAK